MGCRDIGFRKLDFVAKTQFLFRFDGLIDFHTKPDYEEKFRIQYRLELLYWKSHNIFGPRD